MANPALLAAPELARPGAFNDLGMGTPAADLNALAHLVRQARRPGADRACVVEVGSWAGRTALAMADAGATVWCVDTWEGSDPAGGDDTRERVAAWGGGGEVFRTFCRNCGPRLFRDVFPCRGPSLLWASCWPAPADVVFIDADHGYEAVKADILAWLPHVRPGGVICGHDLGVFPGVDRAVAELVPGFRRAGEFVWWASAPR